MSRTMTQARGDKKKCDVLFSKIIRSRGNCENCGTTRTLQTSHIISRRYSHTRTYEPNAHCLCAGCHNKWHDDGVWASAFLWQTRTTAEIDALEARSLERAKFDWSAELERLKAVAAEMDL
jgi:5-methylcytosine-specific restriction endonuclease McrA